jgi:hypothetical protein
VTGNDVRNNSNHGISWEISAKALFADNVIADNGGDGLRVNDGSGAEIWNNTITGNGRTLNLVQDARRGARLSDPGHDPRQKLPDPTMTWLVGDIRIGNNVLGAPKAGANCVLCVEDYSHERTAAQMRLTVDGNVYYRPDKSPTWLVIWSRGPGDPQVFTTLEAFRKASAQESAGAAPPGPVAEQTNPALPLPASVARLIGS